MPYNSTKWLDHGGLEIVGHAHVIVVGHDLEGARTSEEVIVLEAADSDAVVSTGGSLWDLDVVVAHCTDKTDVKRRNVSARVALWRVKGKQS